MKVLHAPVAFAGQPNIMVHGLKQYGIDAEHWRYLGRNPFSYKEDRTFDPMPTAKASNVFKDIFIDFITQGFDIFHFWHIGLIFGNTGKYDLLTGLEIPLIKARNKKILWRFTGYDIRSHKGSLDRNPYSEFRYNPEYSVNFDDGNRNLFLDYLKSYVDEFIVTDPEMQQWMPEAQIIPRIIDIDTFPYIGVSPKEKPLVVHAPSDRLVKGSRFVIKAVEELQSEGLQFHFRLVEGLSNEEARKIYQKADIIIDQLHIGWYGVLTMEAMALGKPAMVYIQDGLSEKIGYKHLPLINTNPENIKRDLKMLISDFEQRKEIGDAARKFAEAYHSISAVIPNVIQLYHNVSKKPNKVPNNFADIEYFMAHRQSMMERKPFNIGHWKRPFTLEE